MVERLNWRQMIKVDESLPEGPEVARVFDEYFEVFAQPPGEFVDGMFHLEDGHPCLKCGKRLNQGMIPASEDCGGFRWTIVHGEGECAHCRWPARMHHDIKWRGGVLLARIPFVCFQYHPDYVRKQ